MQRLRESGTGSSAAPFGRTFVAFGHRNESRAANTSHIIIFFRMFERDEKEDEHAKTTSFLEGLNPQIALNTPFAFQSDNSQYVHSLSGLEIHRKVS